MCVNKNEIKNNLRLDLYREPASFLKGFCLSRLRAASRVRVVYIKWFKKDLGVAMTPHKSALSLVGINYPKQMPPFPFLGEFYIFGWKSAKMHFQPLVL